MSFYETHVANFRTTQPKLEALGELGKNELPQGPTCSNLKAHISIRLLKNCFARVPAYATRFDVKTPQAPRYKDPT